MPAPFDGAGVGPTGEIWFTGAPDLPAPLLVKYLFTSERLSVQVHPDDSQAQSAGQPGGKSECWYVLEAEPDARLGIGLRQRVDAATLRSAALDGSIEKLIDWKPVEAGSFYYIPAGTIHAIGGGVSVVEVQQNNDITYRLYDYGRPRELHLEEGLKVGRPERYDLPDHIVDRDHSGRILAEPDAPFSLDSVAAKAGTEITIDEQLAWFIPLAGSGTVEGASWTAGECWLLQGPARFNVDADAHALVASVR